MAGWIQRHLSFPQSVSVEDFVRHNFQLSLKSIGGYVYADDKDQVKVNVL